MVRATCRECARAGYGDFRLGVMQWCCAVKTGDGGHYSVVFRFVDAIMSSAE